MTNKEALGILHKGIAPNPTANNECIELCKKALEKHIPKKVKIDEGYALCPICNHCIEDIDFISGNSHKYCDCCGQALDLDWSDTE